MYAFGSRKRAPAFPSRQGRAACIHLMADQFDIAGVRASVCTACTAPPMQGFMFVCPAVTCMCRSGAPCVPLALEPLHAWQQLTAWDARAAAIASHPPMGQPTSWCCTHASAASRIHRIARSVLLLSAPSMLKLPVRLHAWCAWGAHGTGRSSPMGPPCARAMHGSSRTCCIGGGKAKADTSKRVQMDMGGSSAAPLAQSLG